MLRSSLAALALTGALAAPAAAFDIDAMTDSERAIFRSEIRDYLLENPEVLMEAIQILEERRAGASAAQEDQMLAENRDAIFDDGYSFVGGNPDGDVTIVEFMDYRCGFCKRAFPEVEELITSDGNIRFIVKEFPILGDASVLAARYAIAAKMEAGDAVYKEVHDKLMTWGGEINEAALGRIARGVDMDHDAVMARMNDPEIDEMIRKNRELGAKLQIQGTPSFIMGETFVRGYVELDQMREIVRLVREEQG
jgi:protein-disulfide isomerase